MMRVISISFVFSKQFRLVFRTIPSQNQLTGPWEASNDGTDWLGLEVARIQYLHTRRSRAQGIVSAGAIILIFTASFLPAALRQIGRVGYLPAGQTFFFPCAC